jgi:hypothetical protein
MKYAKTESGQLAFKQRSPLLSAKQRSAFILFDGSKSHEQVMASVGVTQADIDHMVEQGFLAATEPTAGAAPVAAADTPSAVDDDPWGPGKRTQQERYAEAMHIATSLTAGLGLRGFRLNLAVESAAGYYGLVELLPEMRKALGAKACEKLEHVLKG